MPKDTPITSSSIPEPTRKAYAKEGILTVIPACSVFNRSPQYNVVNRTGGQLSDHDAQALARSRIETEALANWAMQTGQKSSFVRGQLSVVDIFPPGGANAVDAGAKIMILETDPGCQFPATVTVVPQAGAPAKFAIIATYRSSSPCTSVATTAGKPARTLLATPAGSYDEYEDGELTDDPAIGVYFRLARAFGCDQSTGTVGAACAAAQPSTQ